MGRVGCFVRGSAISSSSASKAGAQESGIKAVQNDRDQNVTQICRAVSFLVTFCHGRANWMRVTC